MNSKTYPRTATTYWPRDRFELLGIENVLEIGRHSIFRSGVSFRTHVHDAQRLEICYLDKGRHTYRVDGIPRPMNGGDILAVFPGESHAQDSNMETRGIIYWLAISLPPPSKTDAFLNLRGKPAAALVKALWNLRPRLFRASPAFRSHLTAAMDAVASPSGRPDAPVLVAAHILSALTDLIECARRQRGHTHTAWARRIAQFIETHLHAPLRIPDMATHGSLTTSGFNARFRREFGITPSDYVMRRRVDRAKQTILQSPERSLTEIALTLGFSSSQNFATVFKRYAGDTPSAFRKRRLPRPG